MSNTEENKFTFWSLLNSYNKIEIPIIQRDYAQGRTSESESKIRKDFISYLLKNLTSNTPIELDFIYGDVREGNIFVPLDGQQRLTTLFLLHWYIAYKENKLDEAKSVLVKFSYETRPSSHDFITYLCKKEIPLQDDVVSYIKNKASWFDDSWMNDPSVSGMLTVLGEIENSQMLKEKESALFERLFYENAISFYFIPLTNFGMGDELYIRMNARGKLLTSFETFKSSFYKVIKDSKLLDVIKTKIEYEWINALWEYRNKDEYITDAYFLNFFKFISKMLYYKDAKKREKAGLDFTDPATLRDIYSDEGNVEFLVFAFDNIETLRKLACSIIPWDLEKETLSKLLCNIIKKNENDPISYFLIFEALSFIKIQNNEQGIEDYLRVVRNLIVNTNDRGEREWYRIIPSFEKLISSDVYSLLCRTDAKTINGLYNPQVDEEIAKAKLIRNDADVKELFHKAEDDENFKGNITCLLKVCLTDTEKRAEQYDISSIKDETIPNTLFTNILKVYQETISQNDFCVAWGDFINTSVYSMKWGWGSKRCVYDENYKKNISIIYFAKEFLDSGFKNFNEFLVNKEKKTVIEIASKYKNDLAKIDDLQTQLYLLYVITVRLKNLSNYGFFKGEYNFVRLNFAWLDKENGYETPFANNKIIQSYRTQFRYNLGINEWHTPEILFIGKLESDILDSLLQWAKAE